MGNKIKVLGFQEVAKGIKLCLDNAKTLLEEAQILHNNRKFRGSLVLGLFAWEELAKIEQIFNLLEPIDEDCTQKKLKEFNKKFHSHQAKLISSLTNAIIRDIEETGGSRIKKIVKGRPARNKKLDLLNIKESCLYVGFDFMNKKFVEPHIILEDLLEGIIKDINGTLKTYKLFDNSTVEEIGNALELHAGDKYWKDRPFEADTKRIKGKFEQLSTQKWIR